jgi:hypothetical protein
MSDRDDEWISQNEARQLLGLGKATVPKLVARGLLHPRPQRPSLARSEVLALRDARAEAARLRSVPKPAQKPAEPRPPDDEQPWVRADAVAAHLQVGVTAVHQRSRRGRLPYALGSDGVTRFYVLEQVDATLRAQALSRSRDVASLRTGGAANGAGSHEGDAFDAPDG